MELEMAERRRELRREAMFALDEAMDKIHDARKALEDDDRLRFEERVAAHFAATES